MSETRHFTVGELAERGGVSRRTVRYYVQGGLMPAPRGLGRGAHYGEEHVARLLEVKGLQEQGLSLAEIREVLRRTTLQGATAAVPAGDERIAPPGPLPEDAPGSQPSRQPSLQRSVQPAPRSSQWTRLELLPGVELQVEHGYQLPDDEQLAVLRRWMRNILPVDETREHR